MFGFDVFVHWLHLMAAIIWVGSVLFTSLILQPVLRRFVQPDQRLALYREVGKRFSPLQWGAWSVLVGSGAYKLWGLRATPDVFHGPFGRVLAVKLILIAAMAAISLAHTYLWGPALVATGSRHPGYGALAARVAFWVKVNAALLLAIVYCAALLRFNPW